MSSPVHTSLRIYNLLGLEIRTLVDELKEPGDSTVTWDRIYFYRLIAGESSTILRGWC
ncbi:MAG: hypothetical protein ACE5KJ_02710 [Candidatus Zixiibacteriota bacterium]